MEYIASLSYGKDSMYMLEVIYQNNLPLDRIVHVEVMATDTISGDYPEMVEFKKKANKFIKERYGIEVETLRSECIVLPPWFQYLAPEERYVFICDKKDGVIKRIIYLKEK